ncbi:MAG: hemoglobin [Phycisphaerales bacterium]|jgi:hemoglobin
MEQSLYDKLGGFATVRKLVTDFYDKVLSEEQLSPFFQHTDMASLIDHQTKFWATILGGPVSYTHEQLHKMHSGMSIKDLHFDLIVELIGETLEDHDVDESVIDNVSEQLQGYRASIVGSG